MITPDSSLPNLDRIILTLAKLHEATCNQLAAATGIPAPTLGHLLPEMWRELLLHRVRKSVPGVLNPHVNVYSLTFKGTSRLKQLLDDQQVLYQQQKAETKARQRAAATAREAKKRARAESRARAGSDSAVESPPRRQSILFFPQPKIPTLVLDPDLAAKPLRRRPAARTQLAPVNTVCSTCGCTPTRWNAAHTRCLACEIKWAHELEGANREMCNLNGNPKHAAYTTMQEMIS